MKKSVRIILIILSGFIILVVLLNLLNKKLDFFELSLGEILEILVLGFLLYFLNKNNSDLNYKKQIAVELLNEISKISEDETLYRIKKKEDIQMLFITSKTLINRIRYLKKYAKNILDENDIEYMINEHEKYEENVGLYVDKLEKFSEIEMKCKLNLSHIANRVAKIKINIYT